MTPHLLVHVDLQNLNEFPVLLRVLQQYCTTNTTTNTTPLSLPPPPPVRLDVPMMDGALEAAVGRDPSSDGGVVPCKCTREATTPRRGQQQQQQRLFRGRLFVPGQWDEWNKTIPVHHDSTLVHDFLNFHGATTGAANTSGGTYHEIGVVADNLVAGDGSDHRGGRAGRENNKNIIPRGCSGPGGGSAAIDPHFYPGKKFATRTM
jgi:hypothetical protein